MATNDFGTILKLSHNLSMDELRLLNKHVVAIIREKQRRELLNAGMSINIGTIVRFNAKRRGIRYMRVDSFNRAGTAVKGPETDANGTVVAGPRWTVSTNLVEKVK